MSNQAERDRLLQKEWREEVIPELGRRSNDQWIPIFQDNDDGTVSVAINSVLIPNENVEQLLQSPEWGGHAHGLEPGFTGGSEDSAPVYHRFVGSEFGIEPLVILRRFHGLKPDAVEILEEFRLYHNLYDDRLNSKLVRFDAGGNDIDVVKYSDELVQVSRKALRQFLAARDMSLAVFVERRYYAGQIVEIADCERTSLAKREHFVFSFDTYDHRKFNDGTPETYSRLLGKTVISGLPREKCGIWPYDKEPIDELETFIIGVDDNEREILAYSSPYSFGAATTDLVLPADYVVPDYLTKVFFRRNVLTKYYTEGSKYTVRDGYLSYGRKWGLQIDNSHTEYVIVWLGDLGRDLPYTEHKHWRQHNVVPDGTMSRSHFRSQLPSTVEEALNPGESEDSAWGFKSAYQFHQEAWRETHGWHLFKPLRNADSHHFAKLRRPLTDEITEFHDIVLSLSILLQDQINKKELGKLIPEFQKKDANNKAKQNIPLLAEFLESEDFADATRYVKYLRMLQMLRSNSGTVHPRNEKEYQKAVKFFSLDSKSTTQVADEIFTTLTAFLDSLRARFCPDESD